MVATFFVLVPVVSQLLFVADTGKVAMVDQDVEGLSGNGEF